MPPASRPPCPDCGGQLVSHCRDGHPTCTWSKCASCGRYGDPAKHDRWYTPTQERR